MAFSKEQQSELKRIEKNLLELETLSAGVGLNLETWAPERTFEDFSAKKLEVVQGQASVREAAFRSAGNKSQVLEKGKFAAGQ